MAMVSHDNWQSGKTLSQSACYMLDNGIATDVTFTFPNTREIVKGHRFVLMAKSHVFYIMYNSALDKHTEAIEICDIDPVIFKDFLRFLYSDETTLSVESALHLTYCAEKYDVSELKVKCTDFLQTHVDESNVAVVLNHAILYNDDALITTCRDIIEPLKTLSCLEEHQISKDAMELVLGFEGLHVEEVDIFKFCNTWAEKESTRSSLPVNASNRRKVLGPLLRKIPFCSMTPEEFATEVSGKHLLNGQEELQIFRFLCAPDKSNPTFPRKPKKASPIFKASVFAEKKESNYDSGLLKADEFTFVKLPNMQSFVLRGRREHVQLPAAFRVSVSCTRAFRLLGLKYAHEGNYHIFINGNREKFSIHGHDLNGFLRTPVHCEAGQLMIICNAIDSQQGSAFTHEDHVKDPAGNIKQTFKIDGFGQPPFHTLIVQG